MMPMSLNDVLTTVAGTVIPDSTTDLTFESITTDSRKSLNNSLFVALKGAQFDGHDYVNKVLDSGASAAIVSDLQTSDKPQILVDVGLSLVCHGH